MRLNITDNENMKQFFGEKKGLNIVVEVLVFLLVMLVGYIATVIVAIPFTIAALVGNPSYLKGIATGDPALILESTQAITASQSNTLISLFSEIGLIAITLGFCALLQKRRPQQVGFVKVGFLAEYGIGILTGCVIFSLAVVIQLATGAITIHYEGAGAFLILFFLGYMIQGMAEEVLCRGYLMCSIARRYPLWVGILVNSVVFAALHLLNPGMSLLAFVNLILFGVFASLYFIRRGNIWGIGAVHSVWNFVQGNFYGISVSGMSDTVSVFRSTQTAGRELINGGAFGAEGGLAVTIVLVLGILLFYFVSGTEKKKEAV